ncbi:glycosyl transferase family 1 [Methanocella sp. CWC-04]|uniref:Glycosyl transferase family 1 n=1 Tax=Methanooceanicella nereidis TaxID=2052831 RepID=A0AAP2W776_9EURY|nr:glycosyltransferase family 4 protein [Methanocella sp. CWC-04]MCD1296112.1 glycosyl transferase family 1 [Methanocella sp. CWC-04]
MGRKRIAIVVQRYGKEVLGGSESLARDIAMCLSDDFDVEVLTTCALEYSTWANHFPEGESVEDGINIRRFKNDRQRSIFFKPWNVLLRNVPHTLGMEKLWMSMMGPYSSRLIKHVADNRDVYDLFIFVTYMYATTYYCLPLVKDKSILVPTAHDEPYIRYSVYRDIFNSSRKLVYLTHEEKAFVDQLFNLGTEKGDVIGAPVKLPEVSAEDFRVKYGIRGDFILYLGRIEAMKGLNVLIDYFQDYVYQRKSDLKLVLCGKGPMKITEKDNVISLGFISDEDKSGAIKAASAVVNPSLYESFSYSVLESMLCGTPVIANGQCEVLKGHCDRSGAGVSYGSYEEFANAIDAVLNNEEARKKMSVCGIAYVGDNYSPDAVRKKYISTIDGLMSIRLS